MVFPIALRQEFKGEKVTTDAFQQEANLATAKELYFGGLESIGFGRTNVTAKFVQE
jgi:CRISPR-associated protein Cmr4